MQQNIEQLQTPTMGVTTKKVNNNRTTALERTAALAPGGLNAFYRHQIFALDSADSAEVHNTQVLDFKIVLMSIDK